MNELLLILIPIAASVGWYYGNNKRRLALHNHLNQLSRDYFAGLNFLLNEQPDKAVDIFIKLLTVDSETVETHLALGNLFRRRGEIDRAIRVHQNIIARPNLEPQQRVEALAALAQDYYRAGMLDRAERLFLEVLAIIPDDYASLQALLDIYQQQKRWEQAINTTQKVAPSFREKLHVALAHYYCEVAQKLYTEQRYEEAEQQLRQALAIDKRCVRAAIILGDQALTMQQVAKALTLYQESVQQDSDYLADVLPAIISCYRALQDLQGLAAFLKQCLHQYPIAAVVVALANVYYELQGLEFASTFIEQQLKLRPSLKGMHMLIDLQLKRPENRQREDLLNLREFVLILLNNKPIYRCIQCGLASKRLHWQCPGCKGWGVVKRIQGIEGE